MWTRTVYDAFMLRDHTLSPTVAPVHALQFLPDVREGALRNDIKDLLAERDRGIFHALRKAAPTKRFQG